MINSNFSYLLYFSILHESPITINLSPLPCIHNDCRLFCILSILLPACQRLECVVKTLWGQFIIYRTPFTPFSGNWHIFTSFLDKKETIQFVNIVHHKHVHCTLYSTPREVATQASKIIFTEQHDLTPVHTYTKHTLVQT